MSVLLQKPLFEGVSQKELVEQLEAKKKCRDKLPLWYQSQQIYYPNKLHIEQTSSEKTARYKAQLVHGETLIDVTGGFGVDSYYFSKRLAKVFHAELNPNLSGIAQHNFNILGQKNIHCIPKDGLEFLAGTDQSFDWIYIDPSRRNDLKGKVFMLKDCLPDAPKNLSLLFSKSKNILVKASPLLDISQGMGELDFVKAIHVVAVNNEVKELLYVLEQGFQGQTSMQTVNLTKTGAENFDFTLQEEPKAIAKHGPPFQYLYEPNAAILKSGGFKSVANAYDLWKLHQHSHLYTSTNLIDFPGRRFEIVAIVPYSKKALSALQLTKANVTSRNFPISVPELRKKHRIKDGGDSYIFFTTDMEGKRIVIVSKKV